MKMPIFQRILCSLTELYLNALALKVKGEARHRPLVSIFSLQCGARLLKNSLYTQLSASEVYFKQLLEKNGDSILLDFFRGKKLYGLQQACFSWLCVENKEP
jgi:hypothetical protein